jgi:hypothetical protein
MVPRFVVVKTFYRSRVCLVRGVLPEFGGPFKVREVPEEGEEY